VDSTAAVDIPVVHTVVEDMAVLGMIAVGHTAAGTVAAEDKLEVAAVVVVEDSRLLEAEDKREAVENRTVVDKAFEAEPVGVVHIQHCTAVVVLILNKHNMQLNQKNLISSCKITIIKQICNRPYEKKIM